MDDDLYEQFIRAHQKRAEAGDILSIQTLSYLALISDGWVPGDELPEASRLVLN